MPIIAIYKKTFPTFTWIPSQNYNLSCFLGIELPKNVFPSIPKREYPVPRAGLFKEDQRAHGPTAQAYNVVTIKYNFCLSLYAILTTKIFAAGLIPLPTLSSTTLKLSQRSLEKARDYKPRQLRKKPSRERLKPIPKLRKRSGLGRKSVLLR